MTSPNLTESNFSNYPPEARSLLAAHLPLLRQLPLAFLPSLLREVIEYDYKFPAERAELDGQLRYLESLSAADLADCLSAFSRIQLTPKQLPSNWLAHPLEATEQLSAVLWSTHQISQFRDAAVAYGNRIQSVLPPRTPATPRLGIAIIGQGASPHQPRLFQKLREHGTLFTRVDPTDGVPALLRCLQARAQQQPIPYAHWYVDGGSPLEHAGAVTSVSYASLASTRAALFAYIQQQVSQPGMGPEQLRDRLAQLSPTALGMPEDSLLNRFQVRVLTEGSGSQVFSTTFTQWTAREALRRAEPLTLLVRFAPRQRQRPMNELLAGDEGTPQLDPEGSLIDADMASYYQWINQQRLAGADRSSFLVWFEGQRQAVAVSPVTPRGAESDSPMTVASLLSMITT